MMFRASFVLAPMISAVPIIDLNSADASSSMVDAAKNWGFAYITGHGILPGKIEKAQDAATDFFGLSQEEKNSILADKSKALKTARGYSGVREEQLDVSKEGRPDLKEVLDIGLPRNTGSDPHLGQNQLPATMPHLQPAFEAFGEAASTVASKVIGLVAEGLGAPGAFEEAFADPLRVQRMTRYPSYSDVLPAHPAEISCGAHSDYGGVTVLYADGPGLEVLRPDEQGTPQPGTFFGDLGVRHLDEWVKVNPLNGSLVVMFGEALQVMTNGKIQTTKHRVDGGSERQSLTFFYDPSPDFMLKPLEPFSREEDGLYQPRLAGHKGVLLAAAAAVAKMPSSVKV